MVSVELRRGFESFLKKEQRTLHLLGIVLLLSALVAASIYILVTGVVRKDTLGVATEGLVNDYTIVTIYGRSFNLDPDNKFGRRDIYARMGTLGLYKDFNDFWNGKMIPDAKQRAESKILSIQELAGKFDALNGRKHVLPGVHIVVYAPSCSLEGESYKWTPNNLNYQLRRYVGSNLVDYVIKPALKKKALVFVDHQLGKQSVAEAMEEIIDDGYLQFPNVHIAFDPEWHVRPNEKRCSSTSHIGSVDAYDINKGLETLHRYLRNNSVSREIIVVIHQFLDMRVPAERKRTMIEFKEDLRNPNPGQIKLVINYDGLGDQCWKMFMFNAVHHRGYEDLPFYAGIKYFPDTNPYRQLKTSWNDVPPILNESQLLAKENSSSLCGGKLRLRREPVLIIRN